MNLFDDVEREARSDWLDQRPLLTPDEAYHRWLMDACDGDPGEQDEHDALAGEDEE